MIYCDHNASTPLRPEVLEAMLPFLRDQYGNASSVHALGSAARCAVEEARHGVVELIGGTPGEIVFTSGGTESNNLAIQGTAHACRTVASTPIEHASVRAPIAALQASGCEVRLLPVDTAGRIDPSDCADLPHDALLSLGWANNEIGTVQAIETIGAACRNTGTRLHVDAVQAAGKIPVRVGQVDLLSVSSHKIGGPKGVGALFVRKGVALQPLLLGGGQERGRRGGTENVPGIVGFGTACRLAAKEIGAFAEACAALRESLWGRLSSAIPGVRRNSLAGADCLPNTLHVSFEGLRSEALVAALDLDGIAVSGGSACAAGAGEPSTVLMALGMSEDGARAGVRFSFGRGNCADDAARIATLTENAVRRIRAAHGMGRHHG